VPALHLRASEWYEKNGLIAEAVGHALAAGDIQRVARLVEGNALATIYHGELTTLLGWLDALPQEVVHSRPWLCVAHAWMLAVTGQFDAVEPLLQGAEDALAESRPGYAHDGFDDAQRAEGPVLPIPSAAEEGAVKGSEAAARHIAGHIAAIRAYAAAVRVDISRATELTRLALQYLPDEDWMVRSFTTSLWGSLLRWRGDFAAAARVWTELIAISQVADDNYDAVMALSAPGRTADRARTAPQSGCYLPRCAGACRRICEAWWTAIAVRRARVRTHEHFAAPVERSGGRDAPRQRGPRT